MIYRRFFALAAVAALTACQPPASPVPVVVEPDELLVRFQPDARVNEREALRAGCEATDVVTLFADVERWRLPAGHSAREVAAGLAAEHAIRWTQPNMRLQLATFSLADVPPSAAPGPGAPSDPRFGEQWNLRLANFPAAWQVSTGRGVVVAVLDSGVDPTHPDLAANLLPGIDEIDALQGADVKGGVDFTGRDGIGHGTHVAGIIGAVANNGTGIAGAAPDVKLLPVKVADAFGGASDATIAKGIVDAVAAGAHVINMSLGADGPNARPAPVLADAIDLALAQGVVIVAAAGNDGRREVSYPGAVPGVIAVGAVNATGAVPSYSSYGPGLALAAPGGAGNAPGPGVLSTLPTYPVNGEAGEPLPLSYGPVSGTSMAAPHVAAAAALLLASEPGLSSAQVWVRLAATARPRSLLGFDDRTGFGSLDAAAALLDRHGDGNRYARLL